VWGWGNPREKTSFSAGFKALIRAAISRRFAAGSRSSSKSAAGADAFSEEGQPAPLTRVQCRLQGGVHERFWQDME
jgi:hypothetical protein